ncbi:F-box protein At3g44326-like [Hibiscus syriacus]|uniref:F-box protein At3g44326-like n=1 Tax=Hibiscus syriacus TaxID=106335 RepID=UPI001923CB6E|nr:F-box protein At3g44326-like [Hibiscus syriacus]
MESLQCDLNYLSRDILADIMARLDGSTLASAACTCSDLHGIARDQRLWKLLCHSTWPSTALKGAQHLISSPPMDCFSRFYADSYPLIFHGDHKDADYFPTQHPHISPSDFASFIDVYYREKCVVSSVLDGIPRTVDSDHVDNETEIGLMSCLLNRPFKMVLSDVSHDEDIENGDLLLSANGKYGFLSLEKTGEPEDHCEELKEGIRLSWVLLDKKKGKAANLSSWKPLLVKKIWATDGEYILHFGCIIPVHENVLPDNVAKCLIVATCYIEETQGYLRWKEISMRIEDTNGTYINGGKNLIILNQALYCSRTNNLHAVEKGYQQFEGLKQEMTRKKKLQKSIADWVCISIEVAILITLGYHILPI